MSLRLAICISLGYLRGDRIAVDRRLSQSG